MMLVGVPVSKEELVAILSDVRDRVEVGDSFEGSLEYLLPEPDQCSTCALLNEIRRDCPLCKGSGMVDANVPKGTYAILKANYRIGNLDGGQGGMRIYGKMKES